MPDAGEFQLPSVETTQEDRYEDITHHIYARPGPSDDPVDGQNQRNSANDERLGQPGPATIGPVLKMTPSAMPASTPSGTRA